MSSRYLLISLISFTALSGCNTTQTHIGDEDAFLGESVKYDAAIQTINPAPVYSPDSAQPGANGAKGAAAVKRYEEDKVKPVETMQGGGTGMGSGPQ